MDWWLIVLLILWPMAAAGAIIKARRFDKLMREKRRRDTELDD